MTERLLHVSASPPVAASHSRRVGRMPIDRLRDAAPDSDFVDASLAGEAGRARLRPPACTIMPAA